MHYRILYIFIGLLVICGCKSTKTGLDQTSHPSSTKSDGKINATIIQLNDVYEIDALNHGKEGGMARVATIIAKEKAKNPNTFVVLAGDFLNPSLIGTLKENGERIRGRQMVEVMNAIGVDLVVFGNHEFDLRYPDLQKRINESSFEWLGTSVRDNSGQPFYRINADGSKDHCPDEYTWHLTDSDGDTGSIAFFGATITSNPVDYVQYLDWYKTSTKSVAKLKNTTSSYIIGLTHLDKEDDIKLAETSRGINLILGGHDHTNMAVKSSGVWIYKADANAKSIYKHNLVIDTKDGLHGRSSQLIKIDDRILADPKIDSIVQRWNAIMNKSLQQVIADPHELIYTASVPLDAREHSVRYHQTNYGKIICDAFKAASKHRADCAIVNGGSIRLDDQLSDKIYAIDIFRSLPYGGSMAEARMNGRLLIKLLNQGQNNVGKGAYLQRSSNVRQEPSNNKWYIDGREIRDAQPYTVVLTEYLLKGLDIDFLTRDHPDIVHIHEPVDGDKTDIRTDIRRVIIQYLKSK